MRSLTRQGALPSQAGLNSMAVARWQQLARDQDRTICEKALSMLAEKHCAIPR